MTPDPTPWVVALGATEGRFAAAQRLAELAGADALFLMVRDPAVEAYVPALGFPATLPGGSGWRDLLGRAATPGLHTGAVKLHAGCAAAPAVACADAEMLAVFVGGTPDPEVMRGLLTLMPLVASTLRAEQEAVAARGEQRVAVNHARAAESLAVALDGARRDLERALRELEERSRALDEARGRAEAAVRAQDEFLAMLGHELRNPLSPITTALQLLRLKGQFGREHEIIERQVTNLTRLVEDLLDVARLTTGKITLRKEPVEIAEVAARAFEMVGPMLERKRQVLSVNIASRGLVVDADPGRLAQILANLLTNASKYSDDGTRIVITAEHDDAHVRIRVQDQGIGISPEMLDRIFNLFEQHRQAIDRSHGGLGLGLAIVRSLVALHGGTVQASSDGEGQGAEFMVQLPRTEPLGIASSDLEPPVREMQTIRPGLRVLVVDDNQDALTMLADALSTVGYDVRTALDGPVALQAAESFKPDVAILDIGLPVMDGYELAERLRAPAGGREMKLIAVTGYGQTADRQRANRAGFHAHLVKPVPLNHLLEVLSSVPPLTAKPPQ